MPTFSDAPAAVAALLKRAVDQRASDIHIEPAAKGAVIKFRLDGLLEEAERVDSVLGRAMVARLMVMAQLLTYRLDIPQEGRLEFSIEGQPPAQLRLAVIPTLHGLRAAVRLPAELLQPHSLADLQLPAAAQRGLEQFARADGGMLIVTGPAGSGKTTTIYALLRHIAAVSPGSSIVSLEDPVERQLDGVTQIEVSPFGQMTYERALRSILRQDPQVLMLGEIRDAASASLAVQAALSGHRLICTFHAGSIGAAIARLIEMQIEPYQIASSVQCALTMRLLRRTASAGYKGRVPVAEFVRIDRALRSAILRRDDAAALQCTIEADANHQTLRAAATELIHNGITDEAEMLRVLGDEEAR